MRRPAIDLPPFFNGVNRRIGESYGYRGGQGRAVASLNVETFQGDVMRRRGIRSFASAPPLLRPAGAGHVGNGFPIVIGQGGFTVASNQSFYVGSNEHNPETFTGFFFGPLAFSGSPTSHQKIQIEYWNGTAWTAAPWFLDQTTSIQNNFLAPLSREGCVLWRVADLAGWATTVLAGMTTYWIRVSFTNLSGTLEVPQGARVISSPGVRLVDLPPVNGLYEGAPGNASALIVCADRAPRGRELGGNLGIATGGRGWTRPVYFETTTEAGWLGTPTMPAWSDGTGGGTLAGTASSIRKLVEEVFDAVLGIVIPFEWRANEYRGGLVIYNQAASGSPTVEAVELGSSTDPDLAYEHCRVVVNTTDALGAGELREVATSVAETLYVFKNFSATPGSDTFDVFGPPMFVKLWPDGDLLEVSGNDEHELTLVGDSHTATLPASFEGRFSLVREMRWGHARGHRWTFAFNPVTMMVLAANGHELLETDGQVVRRAPADNDSALADRLAAELPEGVPASYAAGPNASRAQFRPVPPSASFVSVFQSRVFVAYGDSLYWSFPNAGMDVWPWAFQATVRESEKSTITGLRVVNNRLLVLTRDSVHEAREVAPNNFTVAPIAQTGFVHQNATCVISQRGATMLAGVSPDGVAVWDGSSVQMLLNDWDDVLGEPVNRSAMSRASAAYVPSTSQAFFAVPVGDDDYPTRILVREVDQRRWWVWSTAYGVSELGVGIDGSGSTFLLIGYADGFVGQLHDDPEDDGEEVEGSITTAPAVMPGGAPAALTSFLTTMQVQGTASFDLDVYGDSSPVPLKTVQGRAPTGGVVLGSSSIGATAGVPLAGREYRTQENRARATRAAHTVQARFKSTARWGLRALQGILLPKSTKGRR